MVSGCFIDHCINEHGWGTFDCHHSNCKFKAYSTFCLKKHLKSHVTENRGKNLILKCPRNNCGKKFAKDLTLKQHLNVHDNILIKCSFCPWAGAIFGNYKLHMDTHFQIKSHACSKCRAAFYRTGQLQEHVEVAHEKDLEKYPCEYCTFQTTASRNLYNHMKSKHCEIKRTLSYTA